MRACVRTIAELRAFFAGLLKITRGLLAPGRRFADLSFSPIDAHRRLLPGAAPALLAGEAAFNQPPSHNGNNRGSKRPLCIVEGLLHVWTCGFLWHRGPWDKECAPHILGPDFRQRAGIRQRQNCPLFWKWVFSTHAAPGNARTQPRVASGYRAYGPRSK